MREYNYEGRFTIPVMCIITLFIIMSLVVSTTTSTPIRSKIPRQRSGCFVCWSSCQSFSLPLAKVVAVLSLALAAFLLRDVLGVSQTVLHTVFHLTTIFPHVHLYGNRVVE